jgi:hypothetical protein
MMYSGVRDEGINYRLFEQPAGDARQRAILAALAQLHAANIPMDAHKIF